ncbi:glutaredoxin family protein [Corynebacterium auriscanis]|uniref:glutaredoxin family protein n=1 Tax=Corynebacterium auriscanis TaxID=99807 RepID=UPI0022485A6B|nr:glutaredoxin family protein [Corynebacterium auriscanis]MCX2162678.1 glutaredoxin family protein [Corynebacterium auriscanis]
MDTGGNGNSGMQRETTGLRTVTLLTRKTCGSCARVQEQIAPVVAEAGALLEVVDVDEGGVGGELALEFGDRVPVVLIDDEEFACWEVDNDELAEALA